MEREYNDYQSWFGMASCASGTIGFQEFLIINIYERNQMIPLPDHCHRVFLFVVISMHLLSKLAGVHLLLICLN